jgi:hypothetical protein
MTMSITIPLADTLPSDTGSGYVAAAYIVFAVILLVYVAIMAIRLTRVERRLHELRTRDDGPPPPAREEPSPPRDESRDRHARERETV